MEHRGANVVGFARQCILLAKRRFETSSELHRQRQQPVLKKAENVEGDLITTATTRRGQAEEKQPNISNTKKCTAATLYRRAKAGTFTQPMPLIANCFREDYFLQRILHRMLPRDVHEAILPDLHRFGERCANDIQRDHIECSRQAPQLQKFDALGNQIDKILTSSAWQRMKTTSAEEGLISIAYDAGMRQKYGEYARVYQMVKILLFSSASGMYGCPLAMTDGAAKILETHFSKTISQQQEDDSSAKLKNAFKCLTSRDPAQFWTSGQWMTEKRGGSDVRNGTETIAKKLSSTDWGSYLYNLHGYKWFSSACDGEMALTLAKITDDDDGACDILPTMFYVETHDKTAIDIVRLKDKLGTRQLPTGELLLDGVLAHRLSDRQRGIASISSMLSVTRLHNAAAAISNMRKVCNIARDYATRRVAFGKPLIEHALHVRTLADMEVQTRMSTLVFMDTVKLLAQQECNTITETKYGTHVLRLMMPLLKLYTAKQAVAVTSEGIEMLGGVGYLEDSSMPVYMRDSQVLPIWEGTTNVLALDVLRSIEKSDKLSVHYLHVHIGGKLLKPSKHKTHDKELERWCFETFNAMALLWQFTRDSTPDVMRYAARDFAYSLFRTYAAALMCEHLEWQYSSSDALQEDKDHCHVALRKWVDEAGLLYGGLCVGDCVDVLKHYTASNGGSGNEYDDDEDDDKCSNDRELEFVMAGYKDENSVKRYPLIQADAVSTAR